jgi:hypothetical protein
MNGLEFARCITAEGLTRVLVHAAPERVSVEVVDDQHHLVVAGDADRVGDYSPMTELTIDADRVARREVWPDENHHGLPVLLPGGEVGVLTAWCHGEDRSWWQWSVEFSNHTGPPSAWEPPDSKLRR